MRQVYINALLLLDQRIKGCGKGLQASLDEFSVSYWNNELAKAQAKKRIILKRLSPNVIHVDFVNRKKVA